MNKMFIAPEQPLMKMGRSNAKGGVLVFLFSVTFWEFREAAMLI